MQPNAIPGDDGDEELYAPEHPTFPTLLLLTAPNATSPHA
jgi:hypothetical protein